MSIEIACAALAAGRVLDVTYEGAPIRVEVHSAGYSGEDPQVYCWQISPADAVGWRLLRLGKAAAMALSDDASGAPRPGYRPGDSIDRVVCCI
jgi:hypothetical protein